MYICLFRKFTSAFVEILARDISSLISAFAYGNDIVLSTKPMYLFSLSPSSQNMDGMNIADLFNKLRHLSLMRIKLGT